MRLAETWQHITLHFNEENVASAVKAAALVVAVVALFSQDLTMLFRDALQSETTSYMLAIPFLVVYVIYRKRKMLRAVIPLENRSAPKETRHLPLIAGILLLATAVMLYWHGSYTFTPLEYHMLALPIFTAGLTLLLFNPQTLRQLAFPIAFLMFLTPPPTEILYTLGATLSIISSEASNAIVNTFGIPSTITGEYGNPIITITRLDGTPIDFTVDVACSGIYSLIGFLIFAAFIAYIIRDKPWKKLALIILGLPLIYLLNIIRITIILSIGYHLGEQLALQIFHLLGGWILIFLGTLLLLVISEKIFKTQIFASPTEECRNHNSETLSNGAFCSVCGRILRPKKPTITKTDAAKIVAIAASVILLVSIQAPVFALTQASPIVVIDTPSGQQVSTDILPQIPGYTLSFFYRDTQFEATAKQDMSLIYLYSPSDQSEDYIWVTIEIAPTRSPLHRWEFCLVTWAILRGYQPRVTQIELRDIQLIQNPPIISRYFVFNYTATGLTQAVLYWYETATFQVDSTTQEKHAKISAIAYPERPEDLPALEHKLVATATEIVNYWQPIKRWSQVTMLISQNGASFAAGTSVTLIAIIALYTLETRKQRKANTHAYRKLSEPNRQIIDAIGETQKRTTPTLRNIAETYQKTIRKTIDENQLLQKLAELEETGIVRNSLNNNGDEPIQTWNAHI